MARVTNTKGSGWLFALVVITGFSACTMMMNDAAPTTLRYSAAGFFLAFFCLWILGWYKPFAASLIALIIYTLNAVLAFLTKPDYHIITIGINIVFIFGLIAAVREGWSLRRR